VFSETVSENVAAIAIGEKLGMKREGCLRKRQRIGERWLDTVVLGILENEWSPGLAGTS
jgi:RimJ/RimL family protein N-acetyltransferase